VSMAICAAGDSRWLGDYHYFTELYASVYKPEDEIDVPKLFKGISYRRKRNL
jgi:hypothetical protein